MAALPIYELLISEDPESELQVSAIALVDVPAIEKNFLAFKDQAGKMNFAAVDEEQQMVVGPAMIPEMLIYRNDKETGEYNVFFSKDTIKCVAEKFYAKAYQGNANLMHDPEQTVDGVNYFLSWIKNDAKGMVGLTGDYPDGTWFVGAKITNPDVWAKVKSGEIKGFSVEGYFQYKKEAEPDEADVTMEKIKSILNEIN